jgi:hypothetical protein
MSRGGSWCDDHAQSYPDVRDRKIGKCMEKINVCSLTNGRHIRANVIRLPLEGIDARGTSCPSRMMAHRSGLQIADGLHFSLFVIAGNRN